MVNVKCLSFSFFHIDRLLCCKILRYFNNDVMACCGWATLSQTLPSTFQQARKRRSKLSIPSTWCFHMAILQKIMSCQSLANVQEDNPTHLLSAVEAGEQHYLTIQDNKYTNALSNFTLSQDNKSMQCILCMTTMQDMVCIFVAHCLVAGNCVTWPTAKEWRWLWLTDAMSSVVLKKLLLCQEW